MIRGFDTPFIPVGWYYLDGEPCSPEHEVLAVRDDEGDIIGLKCKTTGQVVHSMVQEIERLRRSLDISEDVARKTKQHLMNRIDRIQAARPTHVYIAESIFSGGNGGRTRHGVCLSWEDALRSLAMFAEEGKPLVISPGEDPEDTDFWDEDGPIRWMVHRQNEPARWDGHLWIFKERIWTP